MTRCNYSHRICCFCSHSLSSSFCNSVNNFHLSAYDWYAIQRKHKCVRVNRLHIRSFFKIPWPRLKMKSHRKIFITSRHRNPILLRFASKYVISFIRLPILFCRIIGVVSMTHCAITIHGMSMYSVQCVCTQCSFATFN